MLQFELTYDFQTGEGIQDPKETYGSKAKLEEEKNPNK